MFRYSAQVFHILVSVSLCISGINSKDNDLPTPEMIKENGFPVETHEVITEDGYILNLHRIPGTKAQGFNNLLSPVFLQHGLLDSSADWVINGPDKALAYSLASKGHDVWLGNIRGNIYSRNHTSLKPDDEKFWDFTWHEMGYYDIPASIDYVLNVTGHSKVIYIGHSMGTTVFFVMCSTRPEYNNKIQSMAALAPVAFMSHTTSPIRYIAPYAKDLAYLADLLGKGEFLPRTNSLTMLLKAACEVFQFEKQICKNYLFIICGHDPAQFNLDLLPIILGHNPAGTSTKTLTHYAQEIESAKFRQFDYGKEENIRVYNSSFPPKYDLSKISVPISLHYGDNDLLAQPADVMLLYKWIRNKAGLFRVNNTEFNHLDFLWARDAKSLVYNKIETLIARRHDYKDTFTNSVQDIILKNFPTSKSFDLLNSIYEEDMNRIKKLKSRGAPDLSSIKQSIKDRWENLQKKLPAWQNSIANKLESLQGYIERKLAGKFS